MLSGVGTVWRKIKAISIYARFFARITEIITKDP